jgi:putative nucleotidyltransferase with HDIG domain
LSRNTDRDKKSSILLGRERGFFDKSKSIKLFILLIFTACLFIFLHFREVSLENLELNSTAKHYVASQIDFEFPDDESTIILRQRAIKDIDKIYQIKPAAFLMARSDFEQELLSSYGWRKTTQDASLDQIMQALDLVELTLLQARFTNAQTYKKIEEVHLSTSNYYPIMPLNPNDPLVFPKQIWSLIDYQTYSGSDISTPISDYIINYFAAQSWTFEADHKAQDQLKRLLQESIPQQYTHVSIGQHIVEQGEKITSRHIAQMQSMKEALSRNRNLWNPFHLVGSALMTCLLILVSWLYFRQHHPDVINSNRFLSLLVTIMILTLALAKLTEALIVMNSSHFIEEIGYPIFVPFATILLCCLMNERIALFTSGFLTLVMSMTLVVDRVGFLVVNMVTMVVIIVASREISKRKEIFWVLTKGWFASLFLIFAFYLYDNTNWGIGLISDLISSLVFLIITSILVAGLLPLLESTFHVLTDIILMEYMDPSNELLQRLAIEAPGTYQHSIIVGHLAESAAREIGANSLFCRVSTLYHDIGKLTHPQYYTENQQRGVDMHQLLTPLESAQVIISHVSDGVTMARKANLPEPFIDVIKEHHGTTLVYFFYHKQSELMKGDKNLVDISQFRYSGPKPRTKESAIIMIADTLEAASRSLDDLEEDTITQLVDEIIHQKSKDRQFEECDLTFEELGKVRKAMIKTLSAAVHSRVKYPKPEAISESG